MADRIIAAAKIQAAEAGGVAQGWLRRNVWGVLAVAAGAAFVAIAALLWG